MRGIKEHSVAFGWVVISHGSAGIGRTVDAL